ncbi:hypothetical protein COCSUDRAFT_61632 [Coccomyxa subellipsoidea C-169]|uniref:Nucleotide-diphospho-sugar transferase domain-containing protein n=1 Tax=Coccomyxa subellipsoidea (strain C-169) TaxID=574566 RepID=I0Z444_COCSC|nr:hypothetical protein COCSUDRAFT_61632 [Coccomyxa subellipsoidea C-169]EIE25413.1 hypothetical protein COCSUDRAFT_61632 [Coccomyxa subellipsoidea C-169]|eukprot:XP_005649957.1 hypothetical protein COCSUDRAFT_61632 [Coccomyxa subellipsoidea C-169]
MTTIVDAEAAEILLPVFLESLQKVSRRLVPRVLVLASDAQGLQICRTKHAHCLPWFQRLSAAIGALQQLLAKNFNVLAADVDMVWLKDPFAALEPNLSDFLMTVDSTNSTDDSPAQKPCAGLIFARATEPTRALVKSWVGLGREGGNVGPSSMFPMAWAMTQSSYPTQLRVSYLPTQQ